MKGRRLRGLLGTLCLCVVLTGCAGGSAVYVQSVETLMNLGGIAPGDRFGGMVVSENVTQIKKDSDKSVEELLVKEGDDVKEGQALFSYDTEELQLNLDKQKLEKEQLLASIENYKSQIETLEKAINTVDGTTKLRYTIEIQSTQVDLKEAEIKLKTKEAEVTKSENLLANATVVSPITGRIQSINESGTDQYGNAQPYITIQQIGSYRVKGTIGELQRGALREGDRVKILSRTDDSALWAGTVTLVDYENPTQGSDNDRYYIMSSDDMTTASRYPFYVELDSTEGLMLGQHIYMELETDGTEQEGVGISSAFICYEEDGTAYVWAEKGKKLEKRTVTLGEYNAEAGVQWITDGLSGEDYIAYPDAELCQSGASTTHDQSKEAEETVEGGGV